MTLWSMNVHVEPTHALRPEPVGAFFSSRQPVLPPPHQARPFEPGDWHSGRSPAHSRRTAGRKRPLAAAIDCSPPHHENAPADRARTVVAGSPRTLGPQLEASPTDHLAGHPPALASRGFSPVLAGFCG